MSDADFSANRSDGHGVDWPIRYDDIAPWYDHVETFIGVSGNRALTYMALTARAATRAAELVKQGAL